jgi:hypothetical protein
VTLPLAVSAVALLCAAPAFNAAQTQPPAAQTILSGAWELNRQSSNPAPAGLGPDVEGRARRGGPGGGGPGGGGRGGFGGPGMGGRGRGGFGGSSDQPDKQEMQRIRDLIQETLAAPPRLAIEENGQVVTFTDDEGHVRRFTSNGKPEKHQLTSGTVDTRTRWEDNALVVEIEIPHGMKLSRHYALSVAGDARQLVVTTEIQGADRGSGGKQSPLKAVYDPVLPEH